MLVIALARVCVCVLFLPQWFVCRDFINEYLKAALRGFTKIKRLFCLITFNLRHQKEELFFI